MVVFFVFNKNFYCLHIIKIIHLHNYFKTTKIVNNCLIIEYLIFLFLQSYTQKVLTMTHLFGRINLVI